jgi:hypothetical protein
MQRPKYLAIATHLELSRKLCMGSDILTGWESAVLSLSLGVRYEFQHVQRLLAEV